MEAGQGTGPPVPNLNEGTKEPTLCPVDLW